MFKPITFIISLLLLFSCSEEVKEQSFQSVNGNTETLVSDTFLLNQGYWLGQLNISEDKNLPFNFEVIHDSIYIINSEERIGAEIKPDGELLVIKMPIFDSEFRFSITEKGLFGFWHNYARGDYKIDFKAQKQTDYGKNRFELAHREKNYSFDGEWETTFSQGTTDEYKALGIFNQFGQNITGTFVTESGDYRYLQGNIAGDSIYLSCFDGSHAFLFEGLLTENEEIEGIFYSGSHQQKSWRSKINNEFKLENPYSLTEKVDGKNLEFTFPNLMRENVSYPDQKYAGKVVIIQILGSWCPNCMDETRFLTDLHNSYHRKGLEVIGLAFEVPKELDEKIKRVQELKNHFDSHYEFLIAGDASKKEAEKALPAISEITSFPTTIFIDKEGVIRKIHTGFYGPGTGSYYLEYMAEVQTFVQELLNE